PRPAVFLEQLAHRRIVEFESGVGKPAMFVDAVAGTLQLAAPLDGAGREKVGDLGEIAAGPCQPHRERFGPCFRTPFDAPATAACVHHADARLRPGSVLLTKAKRRGRGTVGSTWA